MNQKLIDRTIIMKNTCQIRTIEAVGTISGVKKKVRNVLLSGIFCSRMIAIPSDSSTARGTAVRLNTAVFFAACKKAEL